MEECGDTHEDSRERSESVGSRGRCRSPCAASGDTYRGTDARSHKQGGEDARSMGVAAQHRTETIQKCDGNQLLFALAAVHRFLVNLSCLVCSGVSKAWKCMSKLKVLSVFEDHMTHF